MKKCTRCKLVYETPAEKRRSDGLVLLVCPRCGCRWSTAAPSNTASRPTALSDLHIEGQAMPAQVMSGR